MQTATARTVVPAVPRAPLGLGHASRGLKAPLPPRRLGLGCLARGGSGSRGTWAEAAPIFANASRILWSAGIEPPMRLQHDECGAAPCLLSAGGPAVRISSSDLSSMRLSGFFPACALRLAQFASRGADRDPLTTWGKQVSQLVYWAYCKALHGERNLLASDQPVPRLPFRAEKRAGSA